MNEYVIKLYEPPEGFPNMEVVKADYVYVEGSIAVFTKNVKKNVGQDDEYIESETVASFDITKAFFVIARKAEKK